MSSQILERATQEKTDFSNPVIRWIDYRLPIFTFLHRELHAHPTPRNLNYLWNFGSLAGIELLVMIATGSGRFRPMFKVFFWALVADCVLLTYAGGQPPEGAWLIMSRIGAAYYFAHFFVVLPLVGRVDRPLPISIREAAVPATGVVP